METILLIDGENLKGKIKDVFKETKKEKPVWHEYDFKGLFDKVLSGTKVDKKVKTIILCSSDSDLQPAIEEVKRREVDCVYVGFEVNPNKGISYTTNRTILMRNAEVFDFEKIQKTLL